MCIATIGRGGRFASAMVALAISASGTVFLVATDDDARGGAELARACDNATAKDHREQVPRLPDPHAITPEEAAELNDRLLRDSPDRVSQEAREATIPVVVHVIAASDGTGDQSDLVLAEQVEVLNQAFGGQLGGEDTGFRFTLRDSTRTTDDTAFRDFPAHEERLKSTLRDGGPEVLNIYTADLGASVLGRSTFPQRVTESLTDDGVVVDYRTLPGGGRSGFDSGHTVVHETGHWLSLFHTFQNGCAPPGDYVDDTPYEREAANGCPVGRNSCPNRAGDDPVTNFMNYSDDACMRKFTAGQSSRMWRAWSAYRAP